MEIVPNSKGWTWVLDRPCPECEVDTREIRAENVADMVRANSAGWADVISNTPDVSGAPRRSGHPWSAPATFETYPDSTTSASY